MHITSAVAEFERDLLMECIQADIVRAKASEKRCGCSPSLNNEQKKEVLLRFNEGKSISAIARLLSTAHQTILRVKLAMKDTNFDSCVYIAQCLSDSIKQLHENDLPPG